MNEIRKSCQWVVNNAEYVSIDEQVLKSFAEKVITKEMGMSIFGTAYFAMQYLHLNCVPVRILGISSSIIEWDTSGWHFCEDVCSTGELTVQCKFWIALVLQ